MAKLAYEREGQAGSSLKLVLLNARSIQGQTSLILNLMVDAVMDLVCVTEI